MHSDKVIVVRIYLTESSDLLKPVFSYLKDEAKIRGASIFRAIRGYGESGEYNSALIEICVDLPLIIEFFDLPNKMKIALNYINTIIKPQHMVWWEAEANSANLITN